MTESLPALKALLRRELTIVNQQFIHILTLRAWQEEELAARMTEIDNIDVSTSMKIMDHLVERGDALDLPSESFAPGPHIAGMLAAEEAMEASMAPLVESVTLNDPVAQTLLEAARAPRPAYRRWLREQLDMGLEAPDPAPPRYPETARLFAHLMVMLEQYMAHAFIHWHRGTREGADLCWAASGETMMLATAIDKRYAALGTTPAPSEEMPALVIAEDPALTLAADQALAEQCAAEARRASEACPEPGIAKLCAKAADYAEALAAWAPGQDHPAVGRNKTFSSFARTREKFLN